MTRTPDEIKKGLECCSKPPHEGPCQECPYSPNNGYCAEIKSSDALALIQQLETDKTRILEESHELRKDMIGRIKQLESTVSEKEKVVAELSGKIGQLEGKLDEAINDLHRAVNCPATLVACEFCKNNEVCPHDGTCDAVENDRWQWRGISKEGH